MTTPAIAVNTPSKNQTLPPIEEKPEETNVATIDNRDPEEIEARRRIEELMKLPAKEREARMAVVLDRGLVHNRLKLDNVPADLHYEWIRNDPDEIARMKILGFWEDKNYSRGRSLHEDGTGTGIIGDTICMMTLKENKRMIDKVRLESTSDESRDVKKSRELREFSGQTMRGTDGIIPTFDESKQTVIGSDDVREALARADNQTKR
jgi:hypothetical protein